MTIWFQKRVFTFPGSRLGFSALGILATIALVCSALVNISSSAFSNEKPTAEECNKAGSTYKPTAAEVSRMTKSQKDAATARLEASIETLKKCLNNEVKAFLEKVSEPIPKIGNWSIRSHRDRLTEKTVKTASVPAKSADNGTTARLDVFCVGFKEDTSPVVSIETSSSFLPGNMGLRYRLDQDDPEDRYMPVNGSGHGISLWAHPKTFFGKGRLRVELQPYRARTLFFEFEIAGAEQAIRSLGCRRLSLVD